MLSRNEAKYIQSLYHKKTRDEEDVFIAEGVKTINEILSSDLTIKKIYALKDWIDVNKNIKDVIEITDDELKRISNFETPNKVLAIVNKKAACTIPSLQNQITLMLDGIQDPGNLGTIIRTADWFGVKNIIASNDTANVYNSKVVQSTMGSFLRVNIFYTDLIEFLSNNKIDVYGAMLNGENINSLYEITEGIVLIGNEGKGIRNDLHHFITTKITITKFGEAESLNAAVATGIILWQLVHGS